MYKLYINKEQIYVHTHIYIYIYIYIYIDIYNMYIDR